MRSEVFAPYGGAGADDFWEALRCTLLPFHGASVLLLQRSGQARVDMQARANLPMSPDLGKACTLELCGAWFYREGGSWQLSSS